MDVRPTVYARFGKYYIFIITALCILTCIIERGLEAKVHVDQVPENEMEKTIKALIEKRN